MAFEEPGFSGEPYVLEKGQYAGPEDWGTSSSHISSIQPVLHVRAALPGHMFLLLKQTLMLLSPV